MLVLLFACAGSEDSEASSNLVGDDTGNTSTTNAPAIHAGPVEAVLVIGDDVADGSQMGDDGGASMFPFQASTVGPQAVAWAPIHSWDESTEKKNWTPVTTDTPVGPVVFSNGKSGYLLEGHDFTSEIAVYVSSHPGQAPERGTTEFTVQFGWGPCKETAEDVATYGTCTAPLELTPFDVQVSVTIQ